MSRFQFTKLPLGDNGDDDDDNNKNNHSSVVDDNYEKQSGNGREMLMSGNQDGTVSTSAVTDDFCDSRNRNGRRLRIVGFVLCAFLLFLLGQLSGVLVSNRRYRNLAKGPSSSSTSWDEEQPVPQERAPTDEEMDVPIVSSEDLEEGMENVPSEPLTTAVSIPDPMPPLTDLVHGEKVVGDVSWMLDFAIIGFAKCGTTFLMNYFKKNVHTYMPNRELCLLSKDSPGKLASLYYDIDRRTDSGQPVRVGLKCPKESQTEHAIEHYATYFPTTKFIITTRHPVHWFRSFYNFRTYKRWPQFHPDSISDLVGSCVADSPYVCDHHCDWGSQGVCTDRAKYHHSLSRFGKTPMTDPAELALLDHRMSVHPNPQAKIFLLELGQLNVSDVGSQHLTDDLADFLGLPPGDLTPLREYRSKHAQYMDEERTSHFLDICQDEYTYVRQVLVEIGRDAATWIRDYFLQSPDVVVSSRERFIELLEEWGKDPCL